MRWPWVELGGVHACGDSLFVENTKLFLYIICTLTEISFAKHLLTILLTTYLISSSSIWMDKSMYWIWHHTYSICIKPFISLSTALLSGTRLEVFYLQSLRRVASRLRFWKGNIVDPATRDRLMFKSWRSDDAHQKHHINYSTKGRLRMNHSHLISGGSYTAKKALPKRQSAGALIICILKFNKPIAST
jgi:hypothetical protein